MASSSTSSIHKSIFKYDVFLSFRGEDTRTNFVDHLYDALKRQNIETYKDDKNLEKGKKIGKELIEAIQDSRFHVIVFSKNYASSSWCLDELVKIMECQKTQTGQTPYPIFYDVEPTEVRKQSGAFGEAIAKHENEVGAGKWREALKEAADLGGWELKKTANGHEVEFIKIVVKEISLKLPSMIGVDEDLIGMRTRISRVVSSLNTSPDEFCMIGIAGMGGSGKTTLARAVFDQICNEFEGSSFVENVRECSNSLLLGLKSLQQQVLRDVLNRQDITVNGVFDGKKMMKRNMPGRKALVVLDDVDHIEQLKALAGEPNWFNPGSKIIITTRDQQVLVAHKVVNSIQDVSLLTDKEAICLLSRCAFGTDSPSPGYEELSRQVVSYAAGLPLTITILGSSLYGENERVWIDTLKELEKIPLDGTLQRLEVSYKGLDTNCQEIFLDVACILKGWKEDEAINVLESRGFPARRGLSVLEKRSLITISGRHRYLYMHDHIEEMGRNIVRRSNLDEPRRHSRLWIEKEIKDILANNQGTEATTCINLSVSSKINQEAVMKGLEKMEKLRLLFVDIYDNYSDWKLDEVSQYFPDSLQYLKWVCYPFCSLPKTFQASNLVGLQMPCSTMVQLWEGGERKVLDKLRFLDLSYSELRSFDLGLAPNLEILNLEYCRDLVEFHMPLRCPKLKSLNLKESKLSTLDLFVPNIETLNLDGCKSLVELDMPCEHPQLKSLNLRSPKLRTLNLGMTLNMEILNLEGCKDLVELDISRKCPQLKSLNLSCPMLSNLDDLVLPKLENLYIKSGSDLKTLDLGLTPNLEILSLWYCSSFAKLHIPVRCPKLKFLKLNCSKLSTLDLRPAPNIETLNLECADLVELHMPCECPQLKSLSLSCPKLRSFNFDDLVLPKLEYLKLIHSKLRTLELTLNLKTLILECCDLVELQIPDGDVNLKSLEIRTCSKLKTLDIGRTPYLERLCLEKGSNLVKLHASVGGLKKLINLELQGLLRFKFFGITNMGQLPELDLYVTSVDICPLHPYNNFPKFQFRCFYREHIPSSIGNIEKLISEDFSCACTDLESFFGSICGLQHLTKLKLIGSIPEVPKDLDRLQCLEELTLKSPEIKHLSDGICMLKHLKILKLSDCQLLQKLPEDLGRLECLERLMLIKCKLLQDIPNSICRMKYLKYFSLRYSNRVKELPEELGGLECLEELNIQGTCIKNLPPSILLLEGLRIVRSKDEQ